MASWVVSLHAASYAKSKTLSDFGTQACVHELIEIPNGITMYFYTREKTELDSGVAWPLFHDLMGNAQQIARARSKALEVRYGKEMVFDYAIVGDNNWKDKQGTASGIFEAGNRLGKHNWGFGANDWRSLSWLFKNCAPGDSIYWLCCRAWR